MGIRESGRWGPDVSDWQTPEHGNPHVDFDKVKAAGADFAFVKATEGTGYRSDAWTTYAYPRRLRDAGLLGGSYHFARPGLPGGGAAQADHYLDTIGARATAPGWLPPVLDLEDHGGLSDAALCAWTDAFLKRLLARTGRRQRLVYTSPSFFRGHLRSGSGWLRPDVDLWIAHYTTNPAPSVNGWLFWQHTSGAAVPGVAGRCDRNVFAGTLDELRVLAALEPGDFLMALTEAQQKQLLNTVINVEAALLKGGPSMNDDGMSVDKSLAQIHHQVDRIRETVTLIKTTVDALVDAVDRLTPPPPAGPP